MGLTQSQATRDARLKRGTLSRGKRGQVSESLIFTSYALAIANSVVDDGVGLIAGGEPGRDLTESMASAEISSLGLRESGEPNATAGVLVGK